MDLKRNIDLKAGVFVVRYTMAEEASTHPRIRVSIEDKSKDDVFIILQDQHPADVTLWRPGTSVALRATRPGTIAIEVVPVVPDASTNATIKVDTILQGEDEFHVLGQDYGNAKQTLNVATLKLHGHVAGRGDIEVPANEWLAGPSVPARIEGFAIEWPAKPHNLELRYSAIGPRSNAASTPMVPLGGFAGTRGRALPVLGINIELSGAGANNAQLVAEALFLGSPIMQAKGDRILLSGPSGLEPLIGLKLTIEPKQAAEASPEAFSASAPAAAPATEEAPAAPLPRPVRVFRSKARSSTG